MPVFEVPSTTRSQLVLLANSRRASYSVINESDVDVYIGYRANVAVEGFHKGIPIKASGGSMEDRWHKGTVYIISSAVTSVTVIESNKEEAA